MLPAPACGYRAFGGWGLLLVLLASGACNRGPDVPQARASDLLSGPPPLAVELKWEGGFPNPILLLTVRNVSDLPVAVDKELSFFVDVTPMKGNGARVETRPVDIPNWFQPGELGDRLVTLKPGEALSRRIDLVGGYKVIGTGIASNPQHVHELFNVSEATEAVANVDDVARVEIAYGEAHLFNDPQGFLTKSPQSADFYRGRIDASIDWPRKEPAK